MWRFLGHGITYHLWFHLCLVSILMFSSYMSFLSQVFLVLFSSQFIFKLTTCYFNELFLVDAHSI